jgi:dolichol-phosphate mannosyltransferase
MTGKINSKKQFISASLTASIKNLFYPDNTINYPFCIILISVIFHLLCLNSYNLLTEEAYYWNYSRHLDFGFLDHPPMVAVLIKATTEIFGTNEFGVRISSLLCWALSAIYSYKLTNLISPGAGKFAALLLALLPFFFLQAFIITPDQPLTACWALALFCLYQALVLQHSNYWYAAGFWLGLGMLSKYTIILLGPATLLYLAIVPSGQHWFKRKEPYLCVLIAALLFTPVIYWNATHEWASFVFQGARRLKSSFHFSLHYFLGLLFLFLTPLGVFSLWQLFKRKITLLNKENLTFIQIYTLVPLIIFAIYSLSHPLKFNWIGPGLLALIPWIAIQIQRNEKLYKYWLITGLMLMLGYTCLVTMMASGSPKAIYSKLFTKYIDWQNLAEQVNGIGRLIEQEYSTPVIVPLDKYTLSSELSFYQAKLLAQKKIKTRYEVIGSHIFGFNSLMYRYWAKKRDLSDKTLIIISQDPRYFEVQYKIIQKSPIFEFWSYSPGLGYPISKYYYQIAQMNHR